MDYYKLKDEIISFVQNSPEDVNFSVAVFIAGMQAQKNLMNDRQKKNKRSLIKNDNDASNVIICPEKMRND